MKKLREFKNLLVTGGAGFIGSNFIRYLLQKVPLFDGVVVNLDALTYAANLNNLAEVQDDNRYFFVRDVISNEAKVEHLCIEHEIDTIVHFAAESHVDNSIYSPKQFIQTNVIGTFHLLEVVKKQPHIHFHHVSTDEVYGSLGKVGAFTEESLYCPNSPYAASKAASDHLVRAYATTYGLSTCISNCSNNFGPFQFQEKLIPLTIFNCLQFKPIPIYGNGLNVRDWLYVEDHIEALLLLLEYGVKGQSYNIGGGEEWENLDLVKAIIRIISDVQSIETWELEQLIQFVSDRPGHDFRYAIDHSKLADLTGWKPRHSFKEGLRNTIFWYLNETELRVTTSNCK